ncbi:MucR family transcriptional regulator [Pseudaquidulcibacter saccharophilus]|uniref:MucR family transcriptional regulator n=1 Tax=Pseudaquidulcibacter saccharophilus TaxID=2831900 RepID=UPI001EFF1B2E|nr:MucR family transcriptional regulator [Pseudaquidulcibacter saccharophilus]
MTETKTNQKLELLDMTTTIVAAYVGANPVSMDAIPTLIASVKKALSSELDVESDKSGDKLKPAISINKSVTDDYIICLEDGKKLKMLKRYLRSNYGLSPEDYRKRWGLPADYPMVAPNYAEKRSNFAKKIGLGRGVRGK